MVESPCTSSASPFTESSSYSSLKKPSPGGSSSQNPSPASLTDNSPGSHEPRHSSSRAHRQQKHYESPTETTTTSTSLLLDELLQSSASIRKLPDQNRVIPIGRALQKAAASFCSESSGDMSFFDATIDMATGKKPQHSTQQQRKHRDESVPLSPRIQLQKDQNNIDLTSLVSMLASRSKKVIARQQKEIQCLRLVVKELMAEILEHENDDSYPSTKHNKKGLKSPPPGMIAIDDDDDDDSSSSSEYETDKYRRSNFVVADELKFDMRALHPKAPTSSLTPTTTQSTPSSSERQSSSFLSETTKGSSGGGDCNSQQNSGTDSQNGRRQVTFQTTAPSPSSSSSSSPAAQAHNHTDVGGINVPGDSGAYRGGLEDVTIRLDSRMQRAEHTTSTQSLSSSQGTTLTTTTDRSDKLSTQEQHIKQKDRQGMASTMTTVSTVTSHGDSTAEIAVTCASYAIVDFLLQQLVDHSVGCSSNNKEEGSSAGVAQIEMQYQTREEKKESLDNNTTSSTIERNFAAPDAPVANEIIISPTKEEEPKDKKDTLGNEQSSGNEDQYHVRDEPASVLDESHAMEPKALFLDANASSPPEEDTTKENSDALQCVPDTNPFSYNDQENPYYDADAIGSGQLLFPFPRADVSSAEGNHTRGVPVADDHSQQQHSLKTESPAKGMDPPEKKFTQNEGSCSYLQISHGWSGKGLELSEVVASTGEDPDADYCPQISRTWSGKELEAILENSVLPDPSLRSFNNNEGFSVRDYDVISNRGLEDGSFCYSAPSRNTQASGQTSDVRFANRSEGNEEKKEDTPNRVVCDKETDKPQIEKVSSTPTETNDPEKDHDPNTNIAALRKLKGRIQQSTIRRKLASVLTFRKKMRLDGGKGDDHTEQPDHHVNNDDVGGNERDSIIAQASGSHSAVNESFIQSPESPTQSSPHTASRNPALNESFLQSPESPAQGSLDTTPRNPALNESFLQSPESPAQGSLDTASRNPALNESFLQSPESPALSSHDTTPRLEKHQTFDDSPLQEQQHSPRQEQQYNLKSRHLHDEQHDNPDPVPRQQQAFPVTQGFAGMMCMREDEMMLMDPMGYQTSEMSIGSNSYSEVDNKDEDGDGNETFDLTSLDGSAMVLRVL